MRRLQLQSNQICPQLNSPSKITFPFPPKTFSKQALVHNSLFTTLQNRNSNKTLNRYLCQLLKRKTLSNSPIIPSLPSNSNSNSHISLFQIKKPKSISLSLSLSLTTSMASFKPSIPITSDRSARPSGEVHVIVGPMFAGKTTALLRRIKSEGNNGRNIAMIKSSKDTRYAKDSVVTHDGMKFPCWALPDLSSFRQKFGDKDYEKLDVIGIDEAQFFEDLYEFCCKAADQDGKTVIVAGLDGDYLRKSFGSVLDIIPLADSVTKLTARCELCGKRAFFTLRKTEDTQTELIGGADVYMPVCRQHYINGQVVIVAARSVLESRKVKSESYLEATVV